MERVADPVESRIQSYLADTLKSAGVSPAFVARAFRRVNESLDAKRVQRIHVGDGLVKQWRDIDHSTRLSGADRAFDLAARAGLIPAASDARRGSQGGPAIQVNVMVLSSTGEVVKVKAEIAEHGSVNE